MCRYVQCTYIWRKHIQLIYWLISNGILLDEHLVVTGQSVPPCLLRRDKQGSYSDHPDAHGARAVAIVGIESLDQSANEPQQMSATDASRQIGFHTPQENAFAAPLHGEQQHNRHRHHDEILEHRWRIQGVAKEGLCPLSSSCTYIYHTDGAPHAPHPLCRLQPFQILDPPIMAVVYPSEPIRSDQECLIVCTRNNLKLYCVHLKLGHRFRALSQVCFRDYSCLFNKENRREIN